MVLLEITLILLVTVFGIPLVYYLWGFFTHRRLLKKLRLNWGKPDAMRNLDHDELNDAAKYFDALREKYKPSVEVDDTTWIDLDMDRIFHSIDASTSIVGSEVLYAIMHELGTDISTLTRRKKLAEVFGSDEALRTNVQAALFGIGRSAYHGASRYLFTASFQYPNMQWIYPVLAVAPLTFVLLGVLNSYFFLLALGAFLINIVVHFRTQATWQKEVAAIRHIGATLKSAQKLQTIRDEAFAPQREELQHHAARLRKIRLWLPLFGMESIGDVAIVLEYIKIFFMLDMVSLVAIVKTINANNDSLCAIYYSVGEVDACLSIAQLQTRTLRLCEPQFIQERKVDAREIYHPLVENSIGNDLDWRRNVLISGSNASGKSTFIKAMAVNIILAQSLFLCFAESFSLCRGQVMSAMAVRDNIIAGESYFVVEIRSLKRILDQMNGNMVFCFIDEILRGTNTIERIAASSAVLESMNSKTALCMAATHDTELTRILADLYDNLHFTEIVGEDGIQFDYLLKTGPTQTRNAIRLISTMGYPEHVVSQANTRVKLFEDTQKWKR